MSMNMDIDRIFTDNSGTRIVFGKGSIDRLSGLVEASWSKALLVIGQGSVRKLGYLDRVESALDKAGIAHGLFEGVEPDPTDRTIRLLADRIADNKPDVLIALGGGSSMDAAKLGNVMANVGGRLNDYVGLGGHVSQTMDAAGQNTLLPIITIPTTAGSGSEVTRYAVFTDTEQDLKKIIVDHALKPGLALIDPLLARTCPRELTVTVGLDTLSHLLEGYLSKVGSDHVDPWALEGVKLVWEFLPRAAQDGNDDPAREALARACTIGGLVINEKGTGLPHGFSFSFHKQMSHGNAVALTLPAAWAYSLPGVEDKTRELARSMGLNGAGAIKDTGREAIKALVDFYAQLGHPTKLSQIDGVDHELLECAARALACNELKLKNAPRPVERGKDTLLAILEAAFDGELDYLMELET